MIQTNIKYIIDCINNITKPIFLLIKASNHLDQYIWLDVYIFFLTPDNPHTTQYNFKNKTHDWLSNNPYSSVKEFLDYTWYLGALFPNFGF